MRTLVDIPDRLIDDMTMIASLRGISRAEAIREALNSYVEQNKPSMVSAFGIWKGRGIEGLSYQEGVRSEW
ncbi:ribbon-helix-helix protein, CopG family [Glaciimonas sp. CA11.2]|uniref:ribbon-helix-helix protein, CopG family n=1 Tax=Glaciimonas sp. CA11.2 TaxID=3048601 RepID=UPI002AB39143|nr:ribbon-helix-helix protein, CopG family [Glaciimonas sp. CA11.2]MDY7545066.1 ribbon-helix-helix protein, CopG family [Glaciimonas sp. CA11.2]